MKRPLKVATKLVSKSQFRALQDECDAELKRTGFVDVERGQDLNAMDASTFRGVSDGGHGMEVSLIDLPGHVMQRSGKYTRGASLGGSPSIGNGIFDTYAGFADAPQSRLWALLSQAAHELPRDAELRSLLVDITSCGELNQAAERHGISREIARPLLQRLCAAVGVDYGNLFSPTRPAPKTEAANVAPVRKLSRKEIQRLDYTPPRRIGA